MLARLLLTVAVWQPLTASAWLPGPAQPNALGGFVVDRTRRNEVLGFHRTIHGSPADNAARMNWTGNHAARNEGTTAPAYVGDICRRINYYRALAGLPASISLNDGATAFGYPGEPLPPAGTTRAAACQRAALMFSVANAVSHDPPNAPPYSACWTVSAWNAARRSNLSLGFHGVAAIDSYMRENDPIGLSVWATNGGHRRWLIYPGSTRMATGDVPADGSYRAVNALYVMPGPGETVAQPPAFVPWPSAGWFPAPLMTALWSLSFPNADFSSATVQMTGPAGNVPVTVIDRTSTGMGDPAILWTVPATVASTTVSADTSYQVQVTGITGIGVPSSHSYTVRVFHPDQVNETLNLTGPSTLPPTGASFAFLPVDAAVSHSVEVSAASDSPWLEGAEDAGQIIDHTSGGYALRAAVSNSGSNYWKTGGKAFRLTFDRFVNPPVEDSFELGRELLAEPGARLLFSWRRGYMAKDTSMVVETSADGGATWQALGSPIKGNTSGSPDTSFTDAALDLPATSGPLRVRFANRWTNGTPFYSIQSNPTLPTGIFLDDIRTTGTKWLQPVTVVPVSGGGNAFPFTSASTGITLVPGKGFLLRLRPEFGGPPMPWGPAKFVTVRQAGGLVGSGNPPATGARYFFDPSPAADFYQFQVFRSVPITLLEGAETSPAPRVVDGTSPAYALLSSKVKKSGTRSFRLANSTATTPPPAEEEWLEIDRRLIPSESSVLSFSHLARDMVNTQQLHAEASTDNGATWNSIWSRQGPRYYAGTKLKGKRESKWTTQTVPLAAFADLETRLRFKLRKAQGSPAPPPTDKNDAGVWLDEISVSFSREIIQSNISSLAAGTRFASFDPASAGETLATGSTYRLRLRPVTNSTPGAWGPAIDVTPVATPATGYSAWAQYQWPSLNGDFLADDDLDATPNGIEYAFNTDPTDGRTRNDPGQLSRVGSSLTLSKGLTSPQSGVDYGAEWSADMVAWSTAGITVTTTGGQLQARLTVPANATARFLRWRISKR